MTESIAVVRAINESYDWSIDRILQDIKFITKAFEAFEISYIPRRQNFVAKNMLNALSLHVLELGE